MTIPLYSLDGPALKKELGDADLPDWRVKQVIDGLYRSRAFEFKNITTLPKDIKVLLQERFAFFTVKEERREVSSSGAVKFLLGLADGVRIECVSLPNTKKEHTFCLSSQAGCPLACAFCASGLDGCSRNLACHEMVEQAMWMEKSGFRATNIVFMGMGEPLLNWPEVASAIRVINDPDAMNIGARNITVSTAGVVEGIRKFAALGLQVRLSVSLHFPRNEERSRWMPLNRTNPLPELMACLKDYQEATGRQITFEYVLFDGLNDRERDAGDLRTLCADLRYRVNLIPYNEVKGPGSPGFRQPSGRKVDRFLEFCKKKGINAVIRHKRGSDIDAACGQLRLGEKAP